MIHYTCDRCGKPLDAKNDLRYVVRVEVQATMEPLEIEDMEDDRDHLMEIEEILERLDDEQCELISEDIYQRRRYDLCTECYRKYIRNPVGREPAKQFDFSKN